MSGGRSAPNCGEQRARGALPSPEAESARRHPQRVDLAPGEVGRSATQCARPVFAPYHTQRRTAPMLEERTLPARRITPATPRLTSLLDIDPELAGVLDPERANAARPQLGVSHARFAPGPWAAARLGRAGLFGLLIFRGGAPRELPLDGVTSLELLGPGDVTRPWDDPPGGAVLGHSVSWSVLNEARMAVLDRRVVSRFGAYPELM